MGFSAYVAPSKADFSDRSRWHIVKWRSQEHIGFWADGHMRISGHDPVTVDDLRYVFGVEQTPRNSPDVDYSNQRPDWKASLKRAKNKLEGFRAHIPDMAYRFEIVVELIEWVLSQDNPDDYILRWEE